MLAYRVIYLIAVTVAQVSLDRFDLVCVPIRGVFELPFATARSISSATESGRQFVQDNGCVEQAESNQRKPCAVVDDEGFIKCRRGFVADEPNRIPPLGRYSLLDSLNRRHDLARIKCLEHNNWFSETQPTLCLPIAQ